MGSSCAFTFSKSLQSLLHPLLEQLSPDGQEKVLSVQPSGARAHIRYTTGVTTNNSSAVMLFLFGQSYFVFVFLQSCLHCFIQLDALKDDDGYLWKFEEFLSP